MPGIHFGSAHRTKRPENAYSGFFAAVLGENMTQQRTFFKKSDLAVIAAVVAAALLLLAWVTLNRASSGARADVYVNGALWRSIDLAAVKEPYMLELDAQLHVRIEVMPGSIRFVESECRDKICVNTGVLSKPSDYAACLPARVAIKLVDPDGRQNLDGVTG